MKRIIVYLHAQLAAEFLQSKGVTFFDATMEVLKKPFGEHAIKVIRQDEYSFELEVDEGNQDITSNVLSQYIADNLGVTEFVGNGVIISCFSVSSMPSMFKKQAKNAKFVERIGKYKDFQKVLSTVVKGQQYAVNTVVKGFVEASTFQDVQDKPFLTFFFAGEENTGKTLLAKEALKHLDIPFVRLSSLDYQDGKTVATVLNNFVNRNPNGAIIFDDAEDFDPDMCAIVYTIYTSGYLQGVSYRGMTVFFTTKCGKSLYENSRSNLSHLSSSDILEACQKETHPLRGGLCFHPLVLKAISNEHIVMFNHLQTVDYQNIIAESLKAHLEKIKSRTEINIDLNIDDFARFAMYQNPDERNVDKIVKYAKELVNKEVQQLLLQTNKENGESLLLNVTDLAFVIDYDNASKDVKTLFENKQYSLAVVTKDKEALKALEKDGYKVNYISSVQEMKECFRNNGAEVVILDPTFGIRGEEQLVDIEDFDSVGMDIFNYVNRYHGKVPLELISNAKEQRYNGAYQTLIDRGADKLIYYTDEDISGILEDVCALVMSFELDNDIKYLRRKNLHLDFNPQQKVEGNKVTVTLAKLELRQVGLNYFSIDNDNYSRIKGFDDVIGAEAAKESLRQYSKYLSNTPEYLESGALPPKLLLLNTPAAPHLNIFINGIGKTSLVKALVEETGATLVRMEAKQIAIDGKNTIEAIHEFFKKARYAAPSVLHINDINLIVPPTENEYTIRMLEALNAEIEYTSRDTVHPVIVIGECDPHYGLSERLEGIATRTFVLPIPNTDQVELFIKRYFEDKHITTVSEKGIKTFAKRSVTCHSFVEIENLLEFIINYAQDRKVDDELLKEGFDIKYNGDIDNSILNEENLRVVSYHEIGHYMIMRLVHEHSPFVTVVPRGNYGGYTLHEHSDLFEVTTKQDLLDHVCISFGGRAAEIMLRGRELGTSTSVGSDIVAATMVARSIVTSYGMGDKLAFYRDSEISYNSEEIYANVNRILDEQLERAIRLIELNRENVTILAEALMKNKSMTGDELEELVPDNKLIFE